MSMAETASDAAQADTEFVRFWNEVLAPKFSRFRHVLQGGLSYHSEAVFPKLPVGAGDCVLDVGCGWGDTTMKLARIVGPEGEVVGIDCCDAFLADARADLKKTGLKDRLIYAFGFAEMAA